MGTEYLMVFKKTEIPLRGGLAWEQRPALSKLDDYYSLSLGGGFTVGKEPSRLVVDLAYITTWAQNTTGIIPEATDIDTDVMEHQVFVLVIKDF